MRVLVIGASGVIGVRLVPRLRERGHEVIGTAHSAGKAGQLRALGAEPVALDLLDARAARQVVLDARPEAIIHQATALADAGFSRNLDRTFAQTNRLRTEGTDTLLAAAREAGVRRFVAQSFAPFRYAREGGPVKTEDDPLDPAPPKTVRQGSAHRRRARPGARLAAGASRGARRRAAPPRAALARAADHGRWPGDGDRGPLCLAT